jgi:hypothetical protein
MDKNFINVDDLVRQKLEGREEREPSGAWLNMQELLNKEMPQAGPVGSLLWRRVFSTMAVMLVVGAAGVGGYKLISAPDGVNKQADVTKIPVSTVVAENTARNSVAGKQIAASGTGESVSTSSQPASSGMDNNAATQHVQGLQHASVSVSNSHVGNSKSTGSEYAGDKTATANNNNTGVAHNNATAGNTTAANNSGNGKAGIAAKSVNKGTNIAATGAVGADMANNASRIGITSANNTNGNGRKDAVAAVNARNTNTHNTTGNVAVNTIANDHASKVAETSKNDKRNVVADRIVAGGTKTAANNIAGVNTHKLLNNQPVKDSKNNNVPASVGNTHSTAAKTVANTTGYEPGIPVFVTQSGKAIPGDKLQKLNRVKARIPLTEIDPTAVTQTAKKTIQKMSLVEHFIKTTPGEGFYKLDTVSNVTLTEELGIITETKITPAAKPGHVDSPAKNKAMNQTKLTPANK